MSRSREIIISDRNIPPASKHSFRTLHAAQAGHEQEATGMLALIRWLTVGARLLLNVDKQKA